MPRQGEDDGFCVHRRGTPRFSNPRDANCPGAPTGQDIAGASEPSRGVVSWPTAGDRTPLPVSKQAGEQ